MKRWIATALCLVMCLSMCSVGKAYTLFGNTIDDFAEDVKKGVYYEEFKQFGGFLIWSFSHPWQNLFDNRDESYDKQNYEFVYPLAKVYAAFMKEKHSSEYNAASAKTGSTLDKPHTLSSQNGLYSLMSYHPSEYSAYVGYTRPIPPSLEFTSAKWNAKGNDRLINFTLKNLSGNDTIDAVDIAVYGKSVYGEVMCPDDDKPGEIRYYTCDITIKPGKKASTGYCRLEGLKSAKEIYVAVWRYHVKDGETVECGNTKETDPMLKLDWIYFDIK